MSGARGEAMILDGEEEIPLLLTNRALSEVEGATGRSVLELGRAAETNALGMTETAHLLRVAMEYGRRDARVVGKRYTIDDAWRVLDQHGFTTVLVLMVGAFADVLRYKEGEGDPPV